MTKRLAVGALFLSTLLIAAAYGAAFLPGGAPEWAAWALALGLTGCLVAMMVLGAARQGRVGKLALPFAFVFVVLIAGLGTALALPATDPADPTLWFGLPLRAAVVLFGIGFLPLFVVPVAYALTFDQQTLRPEDLERIRRHRTAADAARSGAAALGSDEGMAAVEPPAGWGTGGAREPAEEAASEAAAWHRTAE